jgi:endogenous inhibitor of DNA gyrase (YacG/DUF329 family)
MGEHKPGSNGNGKAHLHDLPDRASQSRAAKPCGRRVKCPHCGKPAQWEGNPSSPICSERCRLMDLGKWADGSYAIPAENVPDKEEE